MLPVCESQAHQTTASQRPGSWKGMSQGISHSSLWEETDCLGSAEKALRGEIILSDIVKEPACLISMCLEKYQCQDLPVKDGLSPSEIFRQMAFWQVRGMMHPLLRIN